MKTKPIFKKPTSSSYINYEREITMSEYVSIPKSRLRRLIITEVVAWGISIFLLLISVLR
jgi:hypothetical protein